MAIMIDGRQKDDTFSCWRVDVNGGQIWVKSKTHTDLWPRCDTRKCCEPELRRRGDTRRLFSSIFRMKTNGNNIQ